MSEEAPSVGGGAPSVWQSIGEPLAGAAETLAAQFIRTATEHSGGVEVGRLQTLLEDAVSQLGLVRCVDDVLLPAVHELNRLKAAGQRDPGQALIATEAVRSWLNHRGSLAPPPYEMGPVLLACGPRDRQTVGIESLALVLRDQRWPCRMLGARVSTFTLTVAAQAADAIGVVVACYEGRSRPAAVVSLRAVDALGIPVFFAGAAFESTGDRRELPGRYLGIRTEGACSIITNSLAPSLRPRFDAV